MTKDESQLDAGPVEEQAAYWLRVLTDEPTDEHLQAFSSWMQASSRNVMEFATAQDVDDVIQDVLRTCSIDVDALIERSKEERRLERRRVPRAIAASVAMLGLSVASIILFQHAGDTYATTGERRRVIELDDGSVVALNARSKLRISLSSAARDLYLERGQGFFRVRHDAHRPFRVHAGTAIVEALGTQFDVHVARDRSVTAVVVEGVVQVLPKPAFSLMSSADDTPSLAQLPKISAGQSVTIHQDGRTEPAKSVDAMTTTAWWQPEEQLVFKGRSLAAVANEFNRYNAAPKLRVEGTALRARPVSGVFWITNPESLLNALKRVETIEIAGDGDDIIIRDHGH